MTNTWIATRTAALGGYHRIMATAPGGTPVDITFLRDVPTQLGPYSTADPFSESTAQITLPQLTIFDDPSSPELAWMREDTAIDIWWVPAEERPAGWVPVDADTAIWTSPLINERDAICPFYSYVPNGSGGWARTHAIRAKKVWEGFVASVGIEDDETSHTVTLSLQGALFQVDLLLAKPFFPPRPQTLESLIIGMFDKTVDPSLRTARARIEWPAGWALTAPAFSGSSNVFDPNVRPGARWTGYTSRQTGSWDHRLTSFIQGLLAVMLTKTGSGVPVGCQWTLRNVVEGDPTYPAGRTPVLMVRDRTVEPSVTVWCGTPGVTVSVERDATQKANVLYGTGTDLAGTTWRNAVISNDGSHTDYMPLAASKLVYPSANNRSLQRQTFKRETYVQYGTGFDQVDATASAELTVQRDIDPGWAGTVTLKGDPDSSLSRWEIRAGMTLLLRGFAGTGVDGTRFHIAGVDANPQEGTVSLTVDTRYRDLLTLNEAIERTRDALTPAKLLQLNRNSVTIEDIQAPWDYTLGSGYVPKSSRSLYKHKPTSLAFPYQSWVKANPPQKHPSWYVLCHANNTDSRKRWTGPVPILMSEKGTIRRSEFFMVDRDGNLVLTRFHVSLYYNNGVNYSFMPNNGKTWSPWLTGAFDAVNPATGEQWAQPNLKADQSFIIGWGNYAQPAGYSPGLETQGAHPTGLLVDEDTWSFDCSANNPNYDHLAKAGKEPASVITVYAMFYAEWNEPVFFGGRLYRQDPGTDS